MTRTTERFLTFLHETARPAPLLLVKTSPEGTIMPQLTLRTLLAYIDDTLEPEQARQLGKKVAESELAKDIIERIKKVTRRRGLANPAPAGDAADVADPNTVAAYLSNNLDSAQVAKLEATCIDSDAHLAEVAACHQILTLVLTEPVRVPPRANQRMYQLVEAPASIPNRKPGKAVPVGGVGPASPDRAEPDDADAGLLLGMARYGAGSFAGRLALLAAVIGLGVFLVLAVVMALPHRQPEAPDSAPGLVMAAGPAQPAPAPPTTPDPKPKPPENPDPVAPPKPKDADIPPPKPKDMGPDLVKKTAPPREGRNLLGKATTLNTILLSRARASDAWLRLDPAGEAGVGGTDEVLALPGFKGDVALDSGVNVHLWGNVPELLPSRLMESRVRFHVPERNEQGGMEDFDADLTLLAGRIYVTSAKPARVRVRFASEVWDVTVPGAGTDVMFEVVTSFDPGSRFAVEGGPPPRTEAVAAVTRGTAAIKVPDRPAEFPKLAGPTFLVWDSKGGRIADPQPIPAANTYFEKFLLVGSDQGERVQKALADMAGGLTKRDGIRVLLLGRLTEPPDLARALVCGVAVYGQTAIAVGTTTGEGLKPLIDILTEETRGYARLAVVNALAGWIAQAPGNTKLLFDQLSTKIRQEGEPELICRLLRGFITMGKPDPESLDQLVKYLDSPSVAVRELALWNLVNFADPEGPKTDVANTGPGSGYDKFVNAWKLRVAEIKKGPPPKK